MFILKYKKIFLSISAALVAVSLIFIFTFGITVGLDFRGGTLMEVAYNTSERPSQELLNPKLESLDLGNVLLQPTGEKGYIIKTRSLTSEEHQKVLEILSGGEDNPVTEVSYNSVGPAVGRELTRKAIVSMVLVSLTIICFIAFAFRKVSKSSTTAANHGVPSWKYGIISIITLLHDVIIPTGIFALLSQYRGAELDTLFVVAVLTILGLSLSDTIVIFDRVRENIRKNNEENTKLGFKEIVGKSLEQSFMRSLATSLAVTLVLLVIWLTGPVSTRYFALMLTAGMFFGTYSSLFLASPMLVLAEEWQGKKS
ncbi:MAG: protein translocase subunit SecF [bacterium]|nr:protein translocase subunit SecF [bacterium]